MTAELARDLWCLLPLIGAIVVLACAWISLAACQRSAQMSRERGEE